MPDPEGAEPHVPDDLAENLAETYLQSATSGEEQAEDLMNDYVPEESGGPFVEEDTADELDLELEARDEQSPPDSPARAWNTSSAKRLR